MWRGGIRTKTNSAAVEGSIPGLVVRRGGSGGIKTGTHCVAWWQGWDQNQDVCAAGVGS